MDTTGYLYQTVIFKEKIAQPGSLRIGAFGGPEAPGPGNVNSLKILLY